MRTTLRAAVAMLLVAGVARGQSVLGRYSIQNAQGSPVTLTLEADGPGKTKGALTGNGITFVVQGQTTADGAEASGTMRGPGGAAFFQAKREGQQLQVVLVEAGPDGRPNFATARQLTMAVENAVATAPQGNPAPGAGAGAGEGAGASTVSAQDRQLAQLLLSSAWCSFEYAGSQTYTGGSGGRTSTTRAAFSSNGTMQQSSNTETTNSGAPGQVYGRHAGGQTMKWRVQNGVLLLSSDGVQWQSVQLQVTQNSNGYPIVKADGVEYMQCR